MPLPQLTDEQRKAALEKAAAARHARARPVRGRPARRCRSIRRPRSLAACRAYRRTGTKFEKSLKIFRV